MELIGFRVREEDFLVGHPLSAQSGQLQSLPMLFCAAERAEGDVVIPDGSFVPQVGDRLYLIGQPTGLTAFFRLLGRHNPRCRNVFLVGGGRIAHYLTAILERLGIHVKIIERSLDRCRHLSEVLPKATVICGDGTDQELLEEEDVTASDAFVALTDRDEDNLIISLYAMQQGIPKVVAKSNRQNYAGIAHAAGLDSVISPKLLTAGQILQVVRGMQNSKGSVMNALYKIADGHAEAMEFVANATTRNRDTPLRELPLLVEAGALLLPLLVCLFYRENPLPFLLSIAMTGAVGLALSLIRSNDHFFPREGFFAVALIWLLMSAFGALPFFFSGFFPSYVDCFFESVSGFTTTGASILTAVEPLPRGILFWRSFMHWMGGMGVLILTIALLPSLGGRTLHVMRAESPGPIVSKLVPKTSQSSKILYGIYCALTLLEVFCLRIAGMPWYDSLVHSFATAGTGGFSTRNLSIAAYESPAIEVIITLS